MTNLIIVESPAKAKTIEAYLGKNYTVASSYGHIRDLEKKKMGIDMENGFMPIYQISPQSKKTVADLRKSVKKAEMVWLATDEDREGEAIAWHLYDALKLTPENTKRITFNEVTKEAVVKAIENPRDININLVNAQQARRVLDRLVGFELSPVLWQKVRQGLSAGRVQSVSVRLVVEREREIQAFRANSHYQISADFEYDSMAFKADFSEKLDSEESARQQLQQLPTEPWTIEQVQRSESKRSPSAPFTTSTLQQTASSLLGFSVKRTMTVAQRLYEAGHITYMRTDSVSLSNRAHSEIKDWVSSEHGPDYYQKRAYKTKSKSAQEAHEAIRPSDVSVAHPNVESDQKRLYQLIRNRTIASQMVDAKINKTTVVFSVGDKKHFTAQGEEMVFLGFLKVMGQKKELAILPTLAQGQSLMPLKVTAKQTFAKPTARYSEASLVKKLEELGIGRPSTYAPTMSTIQERGYIEVRDTEGSFRQAIELIWTGDGKIEQLVVEEKYGSEKSRLHPTPIAGLVTDFLVKHVNSVIDYQFTANLETDFDKIAKGTSVWNTMVADFYKAFKPLVKAAEKAERPSESTARSLGNHPEFNQPITVKIGRYGAYVQCGVTEGDEKPKSASLLKHQNIDTITLNEAIDLLKLPRDLGTLSEEIKFVAKDGTAFQAENGASINASRGRFGPYLMFGPKKFAGLKKEDPAPETITLEQATDVVRKKLEADAKKHHGTFGAFTVLEGPYGLYVKDGRKNHKIPNDIKLEGLTEEIIKRKIIGATKKVKRKKSTSR